ncbi:tyrosine phosphatase family protein [Amorphus sp. 3PC139-8]|uniref:tyrosine phosphatase family protein n=1 Tax=Amorphus sp. 3PC139-8 TaxID=2735676 RepID=UPI00345DAC69
MIYVTSLARLHETVESCGARHVVTLINDGTAVVRPETVPEENHLFLGFNDIVDPMEGMVLPAAYHVDQLVTFVEAWDRSTPLVVHCFAGISRSTAAAFIAACALQPERDEAEIAKAIRKASPTATPNSLLVALGDERLDRQGRMRMAAKAIGRGRDAFEGEPFMVAIE